MLGIYLFFFLFIYFFVICFKIARSRLIDIRLHMTSRCPDGNRVIGKSTEKSLTISVGPLIINMLFLVTAVTFVYT